MAATATIHVYLVHQLSIKKRCPHQTLWRILQR